MNMTVILCAIEVYNVTMATGVCVGMWDHIMCSHACNMQVYQSSKEYMNTS